MEGSKERKRFKNVKEQWFKKFKLSPFNTVTWGGWSLDFLFVLVLGFFVCSCFHLLRKGECRELLISLALREI